MAASGQPLRHPHRVETRPCPFPLSARESNCSTKNSQRVKFKEANYDSNTFANILTPLQKASLFKVGYGHGDALKRCSELFRQICLTTVAEGQRADLRRRVRNQPNSSSSLLWGKSANNLSMSCAKGADPLARKTHAAQSTCHGAPMHDTHSIARGTTWPCVCGPAPGWAPCPRRLRRS